MDRTTEPRHGAKALATFADGQRLRYRELIADNDLPSVAQSA